MGRQGGDALLPEALSGRGGFVVDHRGTGLESRVSGSVQVSFGLRTGLGLREGSIQFESLHLLAFALFLAHWPSNPSQKSQRPRNQKPSTKTASRIKHDNIMQGGLGLYSRARAV